MSIKLIVDGNVVPYARTKFAGGEIHVNTDCDALGVFIKADLRNSDSIMELLLLNDALRHNGVLNVIVSLSYLPYARQDRVCSPGDAFSLRVMAKLLNQAEFDLVHIDDPHSDVATKLIDHSVGLSQSAIMGHVNIPNNTVFVAPDKGARDKTVALARYYEVPYYFASKVRDPKTGKLAGFALDFEPSLIHNKHVYVFDDICDGGGTFLGLGKLLQECAPASLNLHVTNGIFSNPVNYNLLQDMYKLTATHNWLK